MVISASLSQNNDQENRYAYLLKPIRDMAQNWNIDVAVELEGFLKELSEIQVSFDGGKTTMNFAEAAMLIQGSACVYSKKVDYLYKLNYEVMELILNRKKSQQSGQGGPAGGDDDDGAGPDHEDDEFLTLDDHCEPGRNPTLRLDDRTLVVPANDLARTPKILVKLSETDKNDCNALINRKGEVIAHSSDFKMNTSLIHPSACMLLDASHIALFEMTMETLRAGRVTEINTAEREVMGMDVQGADNNEPLLDVNNEPIPQTEDILMDAVQPDVGGIDDDDDNGADLGGCDLDLDLGPLEGHGQGQEAVVVEVPRMQLRDRNQRATEVNIPAPPPRDFWATLDPHDKDGCPVKGYVKAKKSRVLLKETPATDPRPIDDLNSFGSSQKKPGNPNKVPKLAAFESLFWKHFKQRKEILKRKTMELRQLRHVDVNEGDVIDEDEEAGAADDLHVDAGGFEDNNDDDDVGAPPFVDYDEALHQAQPINREMNFSLLGSQTQVPGLSVPQTYEDLVRAYVDSYMNSVQEYLLVTDLSKRVNDWEEKIVPQIDDEDTREPFDIHVYGSRVLGALNNKQEVKPFREVVKCTDTYQVSRLFAATLQLANQYNVEIDVQGDLDRGMDTMSLRLLSTKRHHEELESYRAPSLNN